jgi:antitoxin component of MazEF toxin-antitoxin module
MTRLYAQIIPIHGSQGIELPQAVLDECGLEKDVILEVEEDRIVIHPASRPIWRKSRLDAEIDDLYGELRDLAKRAADGDDLAGEIETRTRRLRELQAEAADAIEARFLASRHFSPDRAREALAKARQILGDEDPTDDHEPSQP